MIVEYALVLIHSNKSHISISLENKRVRGWKDVRCFQRVILLRSMHM